MSDTPPVRLKPLFLVKPGTVSRKDIQRAERHSGICMIECADPESARYSEPPIDAKLDVQARAALSLLRMILRNGSSNFTRAELTKFFVEALLSGTSPTPIPPVAVTKTK
jgi:hypothetical protein